MASMTGMMKTNRALALAGMVAAGLVAAGLVAAGVALAQDLEAGKRFFLNACGTCHSVEPGAPARQGPPLHGVFGRKAAKIEAFKYSEALRTADLVWDEATLDRWITDAQGMRPGTSMLYRQTNPERRKLIIEYLKSVQ